MIGADIADAVREGYGLNLPERAVPGSREVAPLVGTDTEAVVVETVKLADDRSGDVVVRLYEAHGGRAETVLTCGFPLESVTVTDLLERDLDPGGGAVVRTATDEVSLRLRPFQILTLRLRPRPHR